MHYSAQSFYAVHCLMNTQQPFENDDDVVGGERK
jgi:hypothetical protein